MCGCFILQVYLLSHLGLADSSMMFPWTFMPMFLQLPFLWSSVASPSCFQGRKHNLHKDGDMMIGGFFSLYTFQPSQEIREANSKLLELQ